MKSMDIMEALTDMDDALLCAEIEPSVRKASPKKTLTLRWLPKVAVVAAVIMALTFSVFAVDVALNDGALFGNFFGINLSDRQTELIDDIGRTFEQSVTSNGTTMTVIRGIADEDHYYLHLRVEAPEGMVLPDYPEESGIHYDFNGSNVYVDDPYWGGNYTDSRMKIYYYCNGEANRMGFTASTTTLPDADPTDNVKEFVILFSNCDRLATFNGGWKKELTIHGLFLQGEEGTHQKLLGGNFRFDVWVTYDDWDKKTVELDIEDYSFDTYYEGDFAFRTTVEKIIITPLGLTREFSATKAQHWDICPTGGSVQVVMKDGSSMLVGDYSEYNFGKDEGYLTISELARIEGVNLGYHHERFGGFMGDSYLFDAPVVLEDIDYLVIAGKHIIDVN